MNNYDKIKKICSPVRIILGLGLIAAGIYTGNAWFYLGVVPLIAGINKFCPLCIATDKCSI
jgi:predicted transporter